jgi:twinkle protein
MRHTSKQLKGTYPCDNCGSSDGVRHYTDGHTHCFVCGHTTQLQKEKQEMEFLPLTERKIDKDVCETFGVKSNENEHEYPYFDKSGIQVASKFRIKDPKSFRVRGEFGSTVLFGQQIFQPGCSKSITIVEGECDALAVYQMFGKKYPVVSVKGASSAAKDVAESFEYLNSFENIVICFDKDEPKVKPDGTVFYPGQEAALVCAQQFPIGKVRILTLQKAKDPNDYLIKGLRGDFVDEWYKAPVFTPAGIKLGSHMWEEIVKPRKFETAYYPFESLNKMTYGIRLSELALITAPTGVGKTSLLKEIEYNLLKTTDAGVGFLHLEEPNVDTALGLMSIEASIPLHLPDRRKEVSEEELKGYYDSVINTDRVVIWDHFGSNSIHQVLAKIRHMKNLGCKYIVLDHLSIIVSDQSGDERKQLDEISTKLKTLCMELNIAVIAVIHLNRQGEIRGSAGPEQIANIVMSLERDKEALDEMRRNVTKITIKKNRFCGMTGPASWLYYDQNTSRMRELTEEEKIKYEAGVSIEAF